MATIGTGIGEKLSIRVIVREQGGVLHKDWPTERIAEAIACDTTSVWVDVFNPGSEADSASVSDLLGNVFKFHPLTVNDAIQQEHTPRVDDWESYLFICCHEGECLKQTDTHLREIDIFLGKNFVVTYHAKSSTVVARLQENVDLRQADLLSEGPDYLVYQILDSLADGFLKAIEGLDLAIDTAQDEVLAKPNRQTLRKILHVKRAALRLVRVLAPQRELLNRLARDPYALVKPEHRVYFRDVYDHHVRIHDITETLRDLISSALDTYLSAMSNRTNDVMKVLTVVTVMFLPMSTVVGFFGMNFFADNISLRGPFPRSFLFWISCVLIVATPFLVALWAKRKGWM